MSPDSRASCRWNVLPGGVLQLLNVTQSDASVVLCQVLLSSEAFPAKEWRILPTLPTPDGRSSLALASSPDVVSPDDHLIPDILSPPSQLSSSTKEAVVLECLPSKADAVALVTWTRLSSLPLPPNRTVDQFASLLLHDLSLQDADSYVCSLNSSAGLALSRSHLLRVTEKPFIKQLPQSQAHPSSQTVRFTCESGGSPAPVVQWFKDANPVSLTGRLSVKADDQTLVISQSVPSDTGVYQCLAESEVGSVTAAARLVISAANDQPLPPRILALESLSPTSVRLAFESADPDPEVAHIKAFTIHYTAAGGQELQHVTPNTTAVIDNLTPFTNYSFYVRAYGNSASEPSATFYVQTLEDVPVKSPKVLLSPVSPTALNVSWTRLPATLARGLVTKYEIHYRKLSQTAYHVADVSDGRLTSFILEDLQPNTRYEVRALAGTTAGFPKPSDGPLWSWTSVEMPAVDQHILHHNMTDSDADVDSSSVTPVLVSLTTRGPQKVDRMVGVSVVRLLVWLMAGSAISAALVCLCILTLHCRRKYVLSPSVLSLIPRPVRSVAASHEDRNGNHALVNGHLHLPSMYGDVVEGREMESFLSTDASGGKVSESRVDENQRGSRKAALS